MADDTMAAVDAFWGMAARETPSKVVLPSDVGFPTDSGAWAWTGALLTLAAPALAACGESGVEAIK